MKTIREALNWAVSCLCDYLEAQILLAYVLECDRVKLITASEERLSADQMLHFKQLVERRAQYEPIAYLVGEKEFWSHSFLVTPDVLVPRPDTEKLVEVALEVLPKTSLTVVDVGTGSGIIACTLALSCANWQVVGLDISEKALEVAKHNAERLKIKNIEFFQSDYLSVLKSKKVDVIISNPPYLREDDPHLEKDLTFEPRVALVSGETGLEAFEKLITQARSHLNSRGKILLEHGYDQANAVSDLLHKSDFSKIKTYDDLSGHPRVTVGEASKDV